MPKRPQFTLTSAEKIALRRAMLIEEYEGEGPIPPEAFELSTIEKYFSLCFDIIVARRDGETYVNMVYWARPIDYYVFTIKKSGEVVCHHSAMKQLSKQFTLIGRIRRWLQI